MAAQSAFIVYRKMSDFLKLVDAACERKGEVCADYIVFLHRGNQVPNVDAHSCYRWGLPDL